MTCSEDKRIHFPPKTKVCLRSYDSIFGEKGTNVLGNLGENRGIPDYSQMDELIVPMENYTFLERSIYLAANRSTPILLVRKYPFPKYGTI